MKFIGYWENVVPGSGENVAKKMVLLGEEMKKEPKKYPKTISDIYSTSSLKGFQLIEADNEEQLINLRQLWFPELTFEFVLIADVYSFESKAFTGKAASAYQRMSK